MTHQRACCIRTEVDVSKATESTTVTSWRIYPVHATRSDVTNYTSTQTVLTERQPPTTLRPSDSGFKSRFLDWSRFKSGYPPDCSRMLLIHYLVRVTHLAQCRNSWTVAGYCMRNANKSHKIPLFCNGEESGKVIRNPYPAPDHHHSPKINQLFQLIGPVITPSFNEIGWLLLH